MGIINKDNKQDSTKNKITKKKKKIKKINEKVVAKFENDINNLEA